MRAQAYQPEAVARPVNARPPAELPTPATNAVEKDAGITLHFWLALAALYLVWDYFAVGNKKIREAVEPGNIRTNLYNLFAVGIAAVIFINGMKVLLVKVAAWEIPGLSWLAKKLVPLFQL